MRIAFFYNRKHIEEPELYVCNWRRELLSWKQSYRQSQMYREYQEANAASTSLLQKFHYFAFAIARDTKSGGMAVLGNFDRSQLCSFSQQQMFFPQDYARVYERGCARVHIPPFYGYFTTCRNLHLTCAPINTRM